jgi:hypothetical protein
MLTTTTRQLVLTSWLAARFAPLVVVTNVFVCTVRCVVFVCFGAVNRI